MRRFRRPDPPDLVGLLVFFGAFVFNVSTAARSLPWGDAPEFLAVARTLGIAHPPGYPLYTLLSAAAVRVPLGSPVLRLAVVSAVGGAAAAALVARTTWDVARLAAGESGHRFSRPLAFAGAGLAGVLVALVPEMHAQSTVPEVYALAAAVLAGTLALLTRRTPDAPRPPGVDRRLVLAALLVGIGLAHHLTIVLALPSFLLLAARPRRGGFMSWTAAVVACLIPLSVYAYLPLRAAHDPAVLWAPIDDAAAFLRHVTAADYGTRLARSAPLAALHDGLRVAGTVVRQSGWPALLTAALGLVILWRRVRRYAVALLLIAVLVFVHASLYSIPDIEPYLLPIYLIVGILCGAAVALLPVVWRHGRAWGTAAGAALVAALLVWAGSGVPELASSVLARQTGPAAYLDQMLSGLEPGAVVLARNDETVFPLWYARYVEGRREDVAIIDVRSRAPHLERWFPDVRFPTEEELAASFGSPEMADCSPDGRSVLPAQRYAPLLVALNIEDRPIFADYELARSRFLDRSLPAGYLARIASHPIEAGALGDPEELINAGPWSRWLGPDAAPAGPRTVKIAAARLEEAGKLYLVRGRAADAVMVMEHAAAGAPRLTKAWNDLGVAYVATGRVDEGIEALRRAADLDPSEASTRANLFDAYRRAGLEEEAVRQIRAAIRLEPEETRYRTLLALYLERKGAVREAADVLEEARRALPDDHAAALALGDLLVRSGDYAEALSVYRRAEELDPGSPVVQSSLGRCYWALHDVERAVRAMSRSVELQPQNPRLRYDLAVMLRAIGRRDEALGHLSEAVRVLPGMWRAHLLSAAILLELGRYDDAERELARAAEAGADPGALRQVRLDAAVARGDSAAAARLRRKPGDAVIEP